MLLARFSAYRDENNENENANGHGAAFFAGRGYAVSPEKRTRSLAYVRIQISACAYWVSSAPPDCHWVGTGDWARARRLTDCLRDDDDAFLILCFTYLPDALRTSVPCDGDKIIVVHPLLACDLKAGARPPALILIAIVM